MRVRTLTAAYLLDWVLGDPESFPHSVRLVGNAIEPGNEFYAAWDRALLPSSSAA